MILGRGIIINVSSMVCRHGFLLDGSVLTEAAVNWVLEDKQELIDIIETIYKGAKKGRGLVVSPKGKFGSVFPVYSRLSDDANGRDRLLHEIPLLDGVIAPLGGQR